MQRYRDAIRVLRGVSRCAYDVLETYCFEERPAALWGDAHLAQGLDALANHLGVDRPGDQRRQADMTR